MKRDFTIDNIGKVSLARNRGYVYVTYIYNGKKVKRSIGIKVPDSEWDQQAKMIKPDTENYLVRKAHILKWKDVMEKVVREIVEDGFVPDVDTVRSYFDNSMYLLQENRFANDFWKNIELFLQSNKQSTSKRNYQRHLFWVKSLREYEEMNLGFHWASTTLNDYIFKNFANFIRTKNGYSENTVIYFIKVFKRFIKEFYSYDDWCRYVKVPDLKSNPIPLTEEEFIRLYYLDLDGKEEEIRNIFCLLCLTGMELNDLKKHGEEYTGSKVVIYRRNRTGIKAIIPVGDLYKAVLERYLVHGIIHSCDYYNKGIKALFTKYGFDREVSTYKYYGSTLIIKKLPLCKAVTLSTGRETFIQRLIDLKYPINEIITICGVTSRDCFSQYRFSNEDESKG